MMNTLTVKFEENKFLNEREFSERVLSLKSMPLSAHIALTGRCDSCCRICPSIRPDRKVKPADLDNMIIEKLKISVFPFLLSCTLGGNNLGEIMVSDDFGSIIDEMDKYPQIKTSIGTSGTLLSKYASKIAQFIKHISISIDGATARTYERIRGFKFDQLMSGIKILMQEIKKNGSVCQVAFGFTALYENIHELPDLIRLAHSLGVHEVYVMLYRPNFEHERYQCLIYHQKYTNDIFDISSKIAKELGLELKQPRFPCPEETGIKEKVVKNNQNNAAICQVPWRRFSLDEQGLVSPCCSNPTVMGNLKRQSFEEIWNGKRYRRFRKKIVQNPDIYCLNCFQKDSRDIETNLLKVIGSSMPLATLVTSDIFKTVSSYKFLRPILPIVRKLSSRC